MNTPYLHNIFLHVYLKNIFSGLQPCPFIMPFMHYLIDVKVRTNLSSPAVANRSPLGEKFTELTAPPCPLRVNIGCPSNKSST